MNTLAKMKGVVVCALLTFLTSTGTAQNFQGTITYVQDIALPKSFLDMGITKELMKSELNKDDSWFDTVRISYKQGNYVMAANNKKRTLKIYKADVNTIYGFNDNERDVCSVQDAVDLDFDGKPDKPTVTEVDSAVTIMGQPCKIIRMSWKMSKVDYYYNSTQARVDPSYFSKHSSEGLSDFVARARCLPLQIVRNVMGMSMIQTAVAIKSEDVKAALFTVPDLVEDESLNVIKLPGVKAMRIKK